ncbi:putative beta-lysine N-acetyltransferase [Bacillus sp. AK031]
MQFSKTIISKMASLDIYFDSFNQRIRVDGYTGNLDEIHKLIQFHADKANAEKVIVKSRREHLLAFLSSGFELEAVVGGYFEGSDVYFLSKFLTEKRKVPLHWMKAENVFENVMQLEADSKKPLHAFTLHKAGISDAERLAGLYESVFPVYPVPLQKPEFVRKSIESGTVFLFIERKNEIISAASAEINFRHRNAELTDCATHPSFRGGGLMKQLLSGLEQYLVEQQIYCAYTIARSLSFGMNAAFKQLGYHYGGRLVNNCYILDKIEDMNVWWKDLSSH